MNDNNDDLENFELYKDGTEEKPARLEQLHADRRTTAENLNTGYSRFIRKVQFALPIMALLLVGLIFSWKYFEGDKIVPVAQEDIQPEIRQEIGKNELVNPRFESMDDKGQPFVVTAEKALQDNNDENSAMALENPSGTMTLSSGANVTLTSQKGTYSQIEQFLDLENNVVLRHSQGYELTTNMLHVDLAENKAWSKQSVTVTGPEGKIDANGIEASSQNETVIFKGPATMLLKTDDNTIGFGEMLP